MTPADHSTDDDFWDEPSAVAHSSTPARAATKQYLMFSVSGNELAAALDVIPDDQREAVIARTWGGLSFEQIAEIAGCSTSTAHRRYEAGLAALRERLCLSCPTKTT